MENSPNSVKPLSAWKTHAVFLIAGIFITWLVMQKCEAPVPAALPLINVDSIKSTIRAEQDTLETLRNIATQSAETATVYIERWHKAKADTVRPYLAVTNDCDTAMAGVQVAYEDLCNELNQVYEVNAGIGVVVRGLEVNNTRLEQINDSLRNLPTKFWKGFKWGFVTGYCAGVFSGSALRR